MVPDTWEFKNLSELTENFDALRVPVKGTDRTPGKIPYYGASGIVDYIDKYIFDGEYLLIAEDGENLRTRKTPIAFIAKGKFWVNNHAHIVRGNEKADTRFLAYALANADISGYLTGSTMPKLTQGHMNRISILTPPLDEQKAIAHILGTLDDKIELNQQMNRTLEGIARALFKSWFIDFDPIRAKLDGRQPSGMNAETAALFPDAFEDRGAIGPIPKGWQVASLGDLVRIKHGYAFKSAFFVEPEPTTPIVVNIGNFRYEGGFRFETTTLKGYGGEYPEEFILSPGEILLVMTCQTAGGEILGIPGRIPNDGRVYLHNQRMGKVEITAPEKIDSSFLYQLFLRPEFNRELFATASGTKILHTSPRARHQLNPECLLHRHYRARSAKPARG